MQATQLASATQPTPNRPVCICGEYWPCSKDAHRDDSYQLASATLYAVPIGGGWSYVCESCLAAHDSDPALIADEGTLREIAEPITPRLPSERCVVCES